MKKLLVVIPVLFGCGAMGEDDKAEDNRVCIVNDSFNNQPNNQLEVTEQAEEAGLEVVDDSDEPGDNELPLQRPLAICGTAVQIDAAITNLNGNSEELAAFLAEGTARHQLDTEEVI